METSDELYLNQQDAIETFYEFHPEEFTVLSTDEMQLLSDYYFVDRDIDVEHIASYAAGMRRRDPDLQRRAEVILQKVFERLEPYDMTYLLSSDDSSSIK